MMQRTISIRDFSGGLNTAIDPAQLPLNMSASLENVEILDSRAIKRRAGYSVITASALADSPVRSLYRAYFPSTRFWLAHCATGIYAAEETDYVAPQFVQAESLGTPDDTYDSPAFSGGSAVYLSTNGASYSMSVPSANNITLGIPGGEKDIYVDGGLVVSATSATTYNIQTTATAHTVKVVANEVRNSTSLLLENTTSTQNKVPRIYPYTQMSANATKRVRVSFYNTFSSMAANGWAAVGFDTLYAGSSLIKVGWAGSVSTTGIVGVVAGGTFEVLDATPSTGWYTAEYELFCNSLSRITYTLISLTKPDGTIVTPTANLSQSSVSAWYTAVAWLKGTTGTLYVDEYREDWALLDDYTSETNVFPDTLTSISAAQYSEANGCFVDTVTYSTTDAFNKIAAVSASAERTAFTMLDGTVYFGTAYDEIRSYDGTTVAAVTASGSAPAAGFLAEKDRRIFAVGKDTDKSLLEYTDVDQPEDWTGGGALRITGKDSGGEATALAIFNDALFYFSYSRVHQLETRGLESDWYNRTLTYRFGCISPDTLTSYPNGIIFLAADGLRAYGLVPGFTDQDGSGFLYLSEAIKPTLDALDPDYIHKACGAYYKNKLYLSVPVDGTENDTTFVLRFAEGDMGPSWTRYSYGVSSMFVLRGDEGGLYGGTDDGQIIKMEDGTSDAGSSITLYYKTPPMTPRTGYAVTNHWRRIFVGAQASALQTLTVQPYSDDVSGPTYSIDINESSDTTPIRKPMNSRGSSLGLVLTSEGSAQDVTISEVTLTYHPGKVR